MTLADIDAPSVAEPNHADMIRIPGGTLRMGSDRHYPEEAPAHLVKVDAFWIDRAPVTNREFRKFVNATGYVTFAEIKPDAKDYPSALPHVLRTGSPVFTRPKQAVDLRVLMHCWAGFAAKAERLISRMPQFITLYRSDVVWMVTKASWRMGRTVAEVEITGIGYAKVVVGIHTCRAFSDQHGFLAGPLVQGVHKNILISCDKIIS